MLSAKQGELANEVPMYTTRRQHYHVSWTETSSSGASSGMIPPLLEFDAAENCVRQADSNKIKVYV